MLMPLHVDDIPSFWIDFDFLMSEEEVSEVMWLYVQRYAAFNPGILEIH